MKMKNVIKIAVVLSGMFITSLASAQLLLIRPADEKARSTILGEGSIAVHNSATDSSIMSPTSGLANKGDISGQYGMMDGQAKSELTSSGETQKYKIDYKVTGFNLGGSLPLGNASGSSEKSGFMLTAKQNKLETDLGDFSSQYEITTQKIGLHGSLGLNQANLGLSVYYNNQQSENSYEYSYSNTRTEYSSKGQADFVTFALGARVAPTPNLSLAATYNPKTIKKYKDENKESEFNLETGERKNTLDKDETMAYEQEAFALGIAGRIPESSLNLVGGIKRHIALKEKVDNWEESYDNMTSTSIGTEINLRASQVRVIPRIGLRNDETQHETSRSALAGCGLQIDAVGFNLGVGYTYIDFKEDADSKTKWTSVSGVAGVEVKI